MVVVTDVFHQSADDGIPGHWCVQYFDKGWAQYFQSTDYDEVEKWVKENAINAGSWI